MKNLYGLLKDYGLTVQSGYIADTERSYQGNYYYLIPNLSCNADDYASWNFIKLCYDDQFERYDTEYSS